MSATIDDVIAGTVPASTAERCAPLILAALQVAGAGRGHVYVHRVLAVIIESRGVDGLAMLEWSELVGIVREANAIGNLDARRWEGRANSYSLGKAYGTPKLAGVAVSAVGDETIAELLDREIV